ncbi:ATP-grasp domain-containing protein [Streptomyces sp. NPDC001222]|uniref:ATP-grasp domain-containing protein n=1 Tax=Streptomyces sp. NPDC001222 TaxID=3364548 RepID=UPI0036AACF3C
MKLQCTGKHLLVINGSRNDTVGLRLARPETRMSLITRQDMFHRVIDLDAYERVVVLPATVDSAEWISTAHFINTRDVIDAIVNYTEFSATETALIADSLGLRAYSLDTARVVNDKNSMRTRLREAGVDDTRSEIITSFDSMQDAAERIGYPLICKPTRGISSKGITRIDGPGNLLHAFERGISGATGLDVPDILIEQFHTGREYSVECLSDSGQHFVVSITEKHIDAATFVEVGHVVPAPLTPDDTARIEGTVRRMLTALGIANGSTHTEVILTDSAVRIVETHLRCGGDRIIEMVRDVTGIDMPTVAGRQSLGESVHGELADALRSRPDERYAAIRYLVPHSPGVVASVEGYEKALGIEGVQEVVVMQGPGAVVTGLNSSASRLAFARALGSTPEEAMERACASVNHLAFQMTTASVDITA